MAVYEHQARRLYVKKSELEQALGITLDEINPRIFKSEMKPYLKIYNSMAKFNIYDAIALLQGINPAEFNHRNDKDFYKIAMALEGCINNGELPKSKGQIDSFGNPDFELDRNDLQQWAIHYGYKWELPLHNPLKPQQENKDFKADNDKKDQTIAEQAEQIHQLKARIAELEQSQKSAVQSADVLTQPKGRTSQPQRDVFSLLVAKNYQDCKSRNALFDSINADMKMLGVRTSDIKYPTLDNLIDDDLRINGLSPFPPKQK